MTGERDAVAVKLKRYDSDEKLTCPKCGYDEWVLQWHISSPDMVEWFPDLPTEWLELRCLQCKYAVVRLPLDAPDTEQGERAE